jgi:hypothetical protein
MTPELQKYYEDRLSMMGEQGWRDLVADVEEMKKATNQLFGISDVNQLFFKKGEISIMDWIINLRQISSDAYEELKNETSV